MVRKRKFRKEPMLPRMFALGALQLQLLLFDTIASGLDAGSITINAYSRNFQSVLVGVAGIALAQSASTPFRYWMIIEPGEGSGRQTRPRQAAPRQSIWEVPSAQTTIIVLFRGTSADTHKGIRARLKAEDDH